MSRMHHRLVWEHEQDLADRSEQGLEIYEHRAGAGGYEIAFVEAPDGVCLELLQKQG